MLLTLLIACSDRPPSGFVVVLSGRVVDESDDGRAATVTLGTPDGEIVATSQADATGEWSTAVYGDTLLGNELVALYDAPGATQGWARYVINLRSPTIATLDPGPWQTWQASERHLPAMQLADEADSGTATLRLVSLEGERQPGLVVELRRGWNASSADPAQQEGVTDGDGELQVSATPGWWTARVPATATTAAARFGVFVSATTDLGPLDGVVPSLDERWLTAALTWGAHPLDLDLHLTSPLAGGQAGEAGTGTYHLWADEPRHPENTTADAEAEMLRTDNDGEGPETLVVMSRPDEGETRLSVLDNDNLSDTATTQLAHGRAQVQVWLHDQDPAYFTVSPGEIATLWRPVEIQSDVLYQVEDYAVDVQPDDKTAF